MITRVFHSRHPKQKAGRFTKPQVTCMHNFISIFLLGCAALTLLLSWGAMEVEQYANGRYDMDPKYNTENTCFFSKFNPEGNLCTRVIKDEFYSSVAYYGVRLDCILSSPLIMIALWLFVQESHAKMLLLAAHICGWTKSISIAAALTCVLIDDPSFMREVFEKAQFGSYESKMLCAFTMVAISVVLNVLLLVAISFWLFVPGKIDNLYHAEPNHASRYKNCRVSPESTRVIVPKRFMASVAVVEDIPHNDEVLEKKFARLASPI